MTILPNGVAILSEQDALSKEVTQRGLVSDLMASVQIAPLIKPGWWIVDGGAALGDHTRMYLDRAGREGVVLAFEANPRYFQCLLHNCKGALCVNRALWNIAGERLYLNASEDNVGAGYLTETAPGEQVNSPVLTVRIDDYGLDRLDFMKLDIEGCELNALTGGIETLKRCHPIMVLEMTPGNMAIRGQTHNDMYDFLGGLGYCWRSFRGETGPRPVACDLICWHSSKPQP